MKIIYVHHAERNVEKNKTRSQNDDITDNGIKDAELVSELFASQNITAIYTSNFYRCKKTAQIINRHTNAPIMEEPRFNEVGSVEGETWVDCLKRNIKALEEIQTKYNDEDTIVCVTSGVNLSAFICWNLGKRPNKNFPFIGATNCAPTVFYAPSKIKYREKKFYRAFNALKFKKNKDYLITSPTPGELKTYLKIELKQKIEQMEMFTNKLKREDYLSKIGQLERSQDLGEVETKKYLGTKVAIEIMQLIKDLCVAEEIDFESVRTTTALNLNEEDCIKNIVTYSERLNYLDTNIQDTLLLMYSTLVSYINYNDLIYNDIERTCHLVEDEEGSYFLGRVVYRLR